MSITVEAIYNASHVVLYQIAFLLTRKEMQMTNKINVLNFATDITETTVEWLWKPYIPKGKITIIQGDPGSGKTMFVSYLISQLSRGLTPNNDDIGNCITSLYQTGEDGLNDTIKPRLIMLGADCNKIYSVDESVSVLTMSDERIEQAIIQTNANVLILDPIQAYLGANIDMHRANEVRPILKKLEIIAQKYSCAVILVGHMNKNSSAKSAYRGIGSIDFQAMARSVLLIGATKENPNIRAIVHDKSSLTQAGQSMAFSLEVQNEFQWLGEYNISSDDLLNDISLSKCDEAITLINECINNGKTESAYITQLAKQRNIGTRTLQTAKKKLNIKSYKKENIWYWAK